MRHLQRLATASLCLAILALSSCSTGMEARRPVPVDLSQFHPGADRVDVVSTIGAPAGQINEKAGVCDVYSLYTTGLGGFGKGLVTAGETITDIGTLGLAEIFWTPIQAGTQPSPHTVVFCYDNDDKLTAITDKNPT